MAESQQAEDTQQPTPTTGSQAKEGKPSPCIIVQGGGYCAKISEHHLAKEYEQVTKKSAKDGYTILMNGGSAVDAVEAAVRVFEDSEYFNAGRGSSLNCFGEVECDAMIMDGHEMKTGAVMTVGRFLNPVSLSRKVMDESKHCALSAEGALEFARMINFPFCNPRELKGKNPNQNINVSNPEYDDFKKNRYMGEAVLETGDTVSAVAMDVNGHLACATSSGGIAGKLKGRVGDVPLVGCGGYANEYGAATTTGDGECIMKMTLARDVVYNMESGKDAQVSAEEALNRMKTRVNGNGGVIAINKDGKFGKACNTTDMVWASVEERKLEFGMNPAEILGTEQV
ncbi:isoaspartyl peptidase L-asparaginase-like, partial [Paramuricea clavata]